MPAGSSHSSGTSGDTVTPHRSERTGSHAGGTGRVTRRVYRDGSRAGGTGRTPGVSGRVARQVYRDGSRAGGTGRAPGVSGRVARQDGSRVGRALPSRHDRHGRRRPPSAAASRSRDKSAARVTPRTGSEGAQSLRLMPRLCLLCNTITP